MADFGLHLRGLLAKRKIKLAELASDLQIPLKSLQEWTQNNRFPRDPEYIKRIADYLGCSVHALLYGAEDPHAKTMESLLEDAALHTGTYQITIRRVRD